MPLYDATVPQLTKMLGNLDRWLEEADADAAARGFDPAVLLVARLAPDQFDLTRQIQSACDTAKFAGARLARKAPSKHEDGPCSLADLRARIADVRAFLDALTPEDFAGAEGRLVALPFVEGKGLDPYDYLNEFALPNFYFHAVSAYSILRHNGVKLGKRAFLGRLNFQDL